MSGPLLADGGAACDLRHGGGVRHSAQLRSGEDLFERRLLRSHPDLRSKRHSRKLLNLLREKRPGQKDKK